MRVIFLYKLIVLFMLGSGCAFAPKAKFGPQKEEAKETVEQVEDFDPLALDEELEKPSDSEAQTGTGDLQDHEQPAITSDTLVQKDVEGVQGYRVQIFVSSNMESAQKIVAEAEEIFPKEVYLQYDAPYYKIRIGNCLTRREGDLLKERAVRRGYRDAWVVRSLVYPTQE